MSCIWAVEKFIWKYQDSSVSNGFLTECCVPWDAIQFYAKTDPAYRVSPPLHNNFLSISVKSKSCFPKWWMHNNIDKPPVAWSATTTDVENPFHTHLNSTSKFWTRYLTAAKSMSLCQKNSRYIKAEFFRIFGNIFVESGKSLKEYWKDISAAYVISADKPTGKVVKIPTKIL